MTPVIIMSENCRKWWSIYINLASNRNISKSFNQIMPTSLKNDTVANRMEEISLHIIPKKGYLTEHTNYYTLALISQASKFLGSPNIDWSSTLNRRWKKFKKPQSNSEIDWLLGSKGAMAMLTE